ncbi:MAG: twin-arginine translocase TatA/TatE family subunit [Armatimonadetes bacterium]|nr:twin-arginine translocase TatA/TatE family subunit [Armatimonadota bacterium]
MPFNLGPGELLVVLAIALIVFGPKKLPEIGKGMGNALREFNKARNDFMDSLHGEPDRDEPAPSYAGSPSSSYPDPGAEPRRLEYPEPLTADRADALPYGSDFQTAGESQPAFRTTQPEPVGAAGATAENAPRGERKV